ncbi:unnamed protein product [Clavelina lepadiformis]|uniref:Uncharacterized protein n=1 Tax=Clavelina lepadiformis TaxID=159417 RepID=A0ABP0FG53_CLALP
MDTYKELIEAHRYIDNEVPARHVIMLSLGGVVDRENLYVERMDRTIWIASRSVFQHQKIGMLSPIPLQPRSAATFMFKAIRQNLGPRKLVGFTCCPLLGRRFENFSENSTEEHLVGVDA